MAEALVAQDQGNVVGITFYIIVEVGLDPQACQLLAELSRRRLACILGDDHAADIKASALQGALEAQHVHVIGDAQIAPDLVLFDGVGTDDDDDLGLVLELLQHLELIVGSKTGKDAGSMVVIEELSSEFQIQLAEIRHSVPDVP